MVPTMPPTAFMSSKRELICADAKPTATDISTTTSEWPSEKKNPTPTGLWPICISLRVELSIAAMWSASTAWRKPKV